MTPIERLRLIAQDAESDALSLDGMPFDGKAVGVMFGNVLASINALARTLEEHLTEQPKEKP